MKMIEINNIRKNRKDKGFIALSSVLIVTFIVVLIVTSITMQSIDDSQITLSFQRHKQSFYDVNSCMSEILYQIFLDNDYSESENLNISIAENPDIECHSISIENEEINLEEDVAEDENGDPENGEENGDTGEEEDEEPDESEPTTQPDVLITIKVSSGDQYVSKKTATLLKSGTGRITLKSFSTD